MYGSCLRIRIEYQGSAMRSARDLIEWARGLGSRQGSDGNMWATDSVYMSNSKQKWIGRSRGRRTATKTRDAIETRAQLLSKTILQPRCTVKKSVVGKNLSLLFQTLRILPNRPWETGLARVPSPPPPICPPRASLF